MSWISDAIGNYEKFVASGVRDAANFINNGAGFTGDFTRFLQNEVIDKSDLRGAQIESLLSGIPLAGGFIKGVEGAQQLEDLYNNTGKVPAYPANNNSGASAQGLGKSIPGLSRKIEGGINDLFEFYTGERDVTEQSLHKSGIMKYGDEL